jgi:hypothetical protein
MSLRDSQVIRRNAPAPEKVLKGPNWNPSPQEDAQMLALMGPMYKLLCYNKVCAVACCRMPQHERRACALTQLARCCRSRRTASARTA